MSDTEDDRTYEEIIKDLDLRWEIVQLNRINEKNKPVNKKEGVNNTDPAKSSSKSGKPLPKKTDDTGPQEDACPDTKNTYHQGDTSGYIYTLSHNGGNYGIYKVGFTKRCVEKRLKELNSETGNPYTLKIEFYKKVANCKKKEQLLHKILYKYRVNKKREFFEVSLDTIRQLFELIDGELISKGDI
jgi:hypothetical protein